jgi:type III pantothenate kinase
MLLVIDIGNTRTKWALADDAGKLLPMEICMNTNIAEVNFPVTEASKVLVSNVAGAKMAQQITQLLQPLEVVFITATNEACGVKNRYKSKLGTDRWAALVAVWRNTKHATVVVNAGTAITIDCLGKDGSFLGGTIMPGLYLMHQSLSKNTAQLSVDATSSNDFKGDFPDNTQEGIQTGCLNAAAGAIHLMLKRLEKHSGWLPKLIISGGDAHKIAQALNLNAKQVIITENIVLQGLVLLSKEIQAKEIQAKEI